MAVLESLRMVEQYTLNSYGGDEKLEITTASDDMSDVDTNFATLEYTHTHRQHQRDYPSCNPTSL